MEKFERCFASANEYEDVLFSKYVKMFSDKYLSGTFHPYSFERVIDVMPLDTSAGAFDFGNGK